MLDKKVSLLLPKQVPGFVREEYPKFISFLEAYYEFLENEQFTSGTSQKNDVINKAKQLKDIADVDQSLELFEDEFFNTFLPYLPKNTEASKDIIIKNIMPLYLSKGSEKSFKLLFRMLFDVDVKINYPRDNILRASDGRWNKENVLKVSSQVYSEYVSDGLRDTYYLPEIYDSTDFSVYVDDVLTEDYSFFREYKRIVFNTIPTQNQKIKIKYFNFEESLLNGRKLVGRKSGATSIVETVGRNSSTTTLSFDIFLNVKNTLGTFLIGEVVDCTTFGEHLIPISLVPYSDVIQINIINGGSSYNVGDPVIINGTAERDAKAIVDSVASGLIDNVIIVDGGAGFKINSIVEAVGYSQNSFNAFVNTIDSTGQFTLNAVSISSDIISDYANISIGAADYGFPATNVVTENVNTIIADALSYVTINNLGTVTSLTIVESLINSTFNPTFKITPEQVTANTKLNDYGIVGEIGVVNGGENYAVGEKITTPFNPNFYGKGLTGTVVEVDANGSIIRARVDTGGLAYTINQTNFIIDTANGTGAILNVASIMGSGEKLLAETSNVIAGQILSIKIVDSGVNYANVPGIDLTGYGDGNAIANAVLRDTFVELPGKWLTSDGKISNEDTVLQGRDYFIDFSYVISSKVEFSKYKTILKDLLHPAGTISYAIFTSETVFESNTANVTIESNYTKQLSGTANISNNSVIVYGNETKFEVLPFTKIILNNEIRNVSTVTSNTQLVVDSPFTSNANNIIIKII